MTSEQDILTRLRNGDIQFPPLRLEVDQLAVVGAGWSGAVDAFATGRWGELELPFVVEAKRRVSLKVLREVAGALKAAAAATQKFPLLIADWLAPEQLTELERLEVSGIDLNGNGVIVVPGKFFVARTGAPNKYRESVPLRNPYRGESAMVARVFLLRPEFPKVEDVWREIQARGGRLSLASVSKALKVLDDDLMITRREKILRILQPDRLLDRLVLEYRAPTVTKRWLGRVEVDDDLNKLTRMVVARAEDQTDWTTSAPTSEDRSQISLVLTGESSSARYAVPFQREPVVRFYCAWDMKKILDELATKTAVEETRRFTNLELFEVESEWQFFDARRGQGFASRIWASPLQTYLELATGDQRQRDSGATLRKLAIQKGWNFSA